MGRERIPAGIEDIIRLAAYSQTRERESISSKERDIIIKRIHPRGTEARK